MWVFRKHAQPAPPELVAQAARELERLDPAVYSLVLASLS
jgi:hypothetical protein